MSKFNLVGTLSIHSISGLKCMQLRDQLIDKLNLNAFEYPALVLQKRTRTLIGFEVD